MEYADSYSLGFYFLKGEEIEKNHQNIYVSSGGELEIHASKDSHNLLHANGYLNIA